MLLMARPNFIGIGAPKSGTTYLSSLLAQNPHICLPATEKQKELNFFTTRYDNHARGIDWYREHFSACRPDQVAGEISPVYFSDPRSPAMIAAALPEAKLVVILRDPARRAYSSFLHDKRAGRVPKDASFREAAASTPMYIEDSRYGLHLRRYLEHLDRAWLHVLFLENLTRDRDGELNRLCAFLDVPAEFPADLDPDKVGGGWAPRSYTLMKSVYNVQRWVMHHAPTGLQNALKKLHPVKLVEKLNAGRPPPIDDALYAELAEQFRPDDEELAELLGVDLPWRTGFDNDHDYDRDNDTE